MSTLRRTLTALTVLLLTAACGPTVNVAPLTLADMARMDTVANFPHRVYRIEPGDTLQIRYTFHNEMNQDVTVQPDGKINATQVGDVEVAGLTTRELEQRLVERTSARLRQPEVVISVLKYSDKGVYIGGEVGRPGMVPYRKGMTPLQAIIAVGGFRDTAQVDSVILIRSGGDEKNAVARKLNLAEVVVDGTQEPLALAPHDIVFVPRTAIADANIWVRQHITELIPIFKGATVPIVP